MVNTHVSVVAKAFEDRTVPGEPDRQILIVNVRIESDLHPAHHFVVAGEGVPLLIERLQKVVETWPRLTTERVAKEGVTTTEDEGPQHQLIVIPDGEQTH